MSLIVFFVKYITLKLKFPKIKNIIEININKTNDELEFNQDNSIEFDEEYRSPGWDRYKKKTILKWKK